MTIASRLAPLWIALGALAFALVLTALFTSRGKTKFEIPRLQDPRVQTALYTELCEASMFHMARDYGYHRDKLPPLLVGDRVAAKHLLERAISTIITMRQGTCSNGLAMVKQQLAVAADYGLLMAHTRMLLQVNRINQAHNAYTTLLNALDTEQNPLELIRLGNEMTALLR